MGSTYKVAPNGAVGGVAIFGADPAMVPAYRHFLSEGIGMGEFLPISIPGGIARLLSPSSIRIASDLLGLVSETIRKSGIMRVACIIRREDIDLPLVRMFVRPPEGTDFVTHVLRLAKDMLSKRLGMPVEVYLAEVAGEEVEFYRLD